MKSRYLFFVALSVIMFASACFIAEAQVFSIHLFYNSKNKTLVFNKNIAENVSLNEKKDIPIVEYVNDNTKGTYVVIVFDNGENEIASSELNPSEGIFDYEIPYFSIAKKLVIYEKKTNNKILEADLSKHLTCNGNGICEFEKGENFDTCIGDCASSRVNYSQETKKILDENKGIIKNKKTGEVLLQGGYVLEEKNATEAQVEKQGNKIWNIVIISATLLLSGLIVFFAVWRIRKIKSE